MLKIYLSIVLLGLFFMQVPAQSKQTISGLVRERGSGESLPGVNVYTLDKRNGTASNAYGFYSLTITSQDSLTLVFSALGYETLIYKVGNQLFTELNIFLNPMNTQLQTVVIEAQKRVSEELPMSVVSIPIQQIRQIPALIGEKDVLKALQLMPGVKKGMEGTAGLYVRGGGPDQNLLILDDAVVYNAFHLFGFLSLFNGDALKSVELIKGGFPARFGGRASSVIEMQMKDGNKEKWRGEGGIGLLTSRLTLEAPLKKDKSSFIVSARRSYIDLLLLPIQPASYRTRFGFYDINAKLNWDIGKKHRVYLSTYFGRDGFRTTISNNREKEKSGFNWGNATATLRWNHLISPKLFANTSLIFSDYQFKVFSERKESNGSTYFLSYSSAIRDLSLKYDLDFLPSPNFQMRVGTQITQHRFRPNAFVLRDTGIDSSSVQIRTQNALEMGFYVENIIRPFSNLQINLGFRLSGFKTNAKTYWNPEPRLSLSYQVAPNWALKTSYAVMNQYLHLLSNSGIGLPTDLWVPATDQVRPQQAQQVALGIAKDFPKAKLALTVEGYYKKMNNIIGYKEGASFLLLNLGPDPQAIQADEWEDKITTGQGWAYGVEFLLQRKVGKLSGWLGYTLSWIQHQLDGVNNNQKFFARYDRRHDISIVGIYQASPRVTLSATWVYSSGNAITLPLASFQANTHYVGDFGNATLFASYYGDRNSFRASAYHRLDLAIQLHKRKRKHERTWEFGLYNAYCRANPFYYGEGGRRTVNGKQNTLIQYSLLPILPSVSYNFKF